MSDAIRDALEDIFTGRSHREIGALIGVRHTTLMRIRRPHGATPSAKTMEAIAQIAEPEQMLALRRAVAVYGGIRIPHPAPTHPDALRVAALITGEADPVPLVDPDHATFVEAWRIACAALRVAAALAPRDRRELVRDRAVRAARITPMVTGVSHG